MLTDHDVATGLHSNRNLATNTVQEYYYRMMRMIYIYIYVRRGRGGVCAASLNNMLGKAPNRQNPDLMIDFGNRSPSHVLSVYHFHSTNRRNQTSKAKPVYSMNSQANLSRQSSRLFSSLVIISMNAYHLDE